MLQRKHQFTYPPTVKSPEEKKKALEKELHSQLLYWITKRIVKEEIIKPKYKVENLPKVIPDLLEELGIATQLRNATYNLHTQARANSSERSGGSNAPVPPSTISTLDALTPARKEMNRMMRERLLAISVEAKQSLVRHRNPDQDDDSEGTINNYIFEAKHILEVITKIRSTNRVKNQVAISWAMIHLELKTPDLDQLQVMFADLHPEHRQSGLDDEIRSWFSEDRARLGKKAIESGYIPLIRQFAKRGVPSSLRPTMYSKMLVVDLTEKDINYLETLNEQVEKWEYLTDELIRLDVHETGSDDNYFVFEEILESILVAVSRDKWLLTNCVVDGLPRLHGASRGGVTNAAYPPSSVVPFRGFCMYASPLCFLFDKEEQLYFVFRAMYARYWCRLHVFSVMPNTLIPLCKLFEDLVQMHAADVVYHLVQLGVQPLEIAFDWILYAFAGYLEVDQVLLLWDRVIGFDSLELVPILAAAIFVFRSKPILKSQSQEDVQDVFEDPKKLKIVPLLQHFLFPNEKY